uniref:PlxyGVORF103 protein n=1 Tax=Plutella xylostella granulovirus TaxID=98383 RepID=A0A1B2CSK8_9BBAC|nr:PlxyGVORF103 protein [Plutella xylostella granulovirus]
MGLCCDTCFNRFTEIREDDLFDEDDEEPKCCCCCKCLTSFIFIALLLCLGIVMFIYRENILVALKK